MIFRLALGLSRSGSAEHRWRRVAVPVSAALATLLVLVAASLLHMEQREARRQDARAPQWATADAPTNLAVVSRVDDWHGTQYTVLTLEPAGAGPTVLPPGVTRLPDPGQAVLSPALADLASREPELAARFPNRTVLGLDGVSSGGELLAYVRPPIGRSLAGAIKYFALDQSGPIHSGGSGGDSPLYETILWPVSGFGNAPEGRQLVLLQSERLDRAYLVNGTMSFLVAPALLVLAVGLAAASLARDERFRVLMALGASRRTRLGLAVVETQLLALPGVAVATLLWALLAPRAERVPLLGYSVVPGDLGTTWWVVLGLVAVVVATVATISLLLAIVAAPRAPRPRVTRRVGLSPWRLVPLVIAVGLVAYGFNELNSGGTQEAWFLAGIIGSVMGVPLVFPLVVRLIGGQLATSTGVFPLLAGRTLEWDPIGVSRPFAAFGMLAFIGVAGSGMMAAGEALTDNDALLHATPNVASVLWLDPQPGDLPWLRAAFPDGVVASARRGADGSIEIGARCEEIATVFHGQRCASDQPYELPDEALNWLAMSMRASPSEIRLVPADVIGPSGSALVAADLPLDVFDSRVRDVVVGTLPAPEVTSPTAFLLRESSRNRWLMAGFAVAAAALASACLLSIVDRLLSMRSRRRHLVNLGMEPARLRSLEVYLFAVPFASVVTVSLAAGLALCTVAANLQGVSMPWTAIAVMVGLSLITGLLGTLGVRFVGPEPGAAAR